MPLFARFGSVAGKVGLRAQFPECFQPAPGFRQRGLKTRGAPFACHCETPIGPDQKDPVGMGEVGLVDQIVHSVDHTGNGQLFVLEQLVRDLAAVSVLLVFENVELAGVVNRPASIGGMSFVDVDETELGEVAELLVEGFQFANLAKEGRSGIRAENQHDGPVPAAGAKVECLVAGQ